MSTNGARCLRDQVGRLLRGVISGVLVSLLDCAERHQYVVHRRLCIGFGLVGGEPLYGGHPGYRERETVSMDQEQAHRTRLSGRQTRFTADQPPTRSE